MTQIKDAVWKEIDGSPSIRLDLARDIINVRALAKLLQTRLGLKGSLDAIISAIRRYEEEEPYQETRDGAMKVIQGARLTSKNHVASVTLEKSEEVVKALPKLFDVIELVEHSTLRIIHAQRKIKLYIDEENLDKVLELFTKKSVKIVEKKLGEVDLDLNPKVWGTPGVLAVLSSELTLHNINIMDTLTCIPEVVLIFREKDLMKAYEVMYQLTDRSSDKKQKQER